MDVPNRRQFMIGSLAACACAACPLAEALAADEAPVDVGPAADFRKPGAYDHWGKRLDGFFIISRNNRLYAVSSTCTHKRKLLVVAGSAIKCPQHGSLFDGEGVVRKGPAKKPLPRLGISINDQGHVIVDPSIKFKKGQWKDQGSYVRIPK